ncbi:hypothetical protein KV100_12650 [Mumia sp. zg.B21]|uniref:hypothetical protein n=1 Tax=Mumia sp. zg.B21 TaxID=2855447 RepID=UPI001C6EABBF|nr:hypothetical protein [Mumia sp. zg.B21]MBW9210504.1 hypothetical protein [Mumia sp. zg.B21]
MRVRALIGAVALATVLAACSGGASVGDPDADSPKATSATSGADSPATGTMAEWLGSMQSCLQEAGWKVEIDLEQNGIIADSVTAEQASSFSQAQTECHERVGKAPNDVPLTPAFAAKTYGHLVEMRQCLADLGYQSSEPPSKAKFVDDMMGGSAPWSPFLDVPDDISEIDWHKLLKECPQSIE